jgi:hypothetical protein
MTIRNIYQPARNSHGNFQKFDEMAKNHDEMVTGAVFGWKKRPQRGHGRRAKIALTEAPRRGGRAWMTDCLPTNSKRVTLSKRNKDKPPIEEDERR